MLGRTSAGPWTYLSLVVILLCYTRWTDRRGLLLVLHLIGDTVMAGELTAEVCFFPYLYLEVVPRLFWGRGCDAWRGSGCAAQWRVPLPPPGSRYRRPRTLPNPSSTILLVKASVTLRHSLTLFKYGGRSPKFIWVPCHVMCTAVLICWDPATPPPSPPRIWTRIRGRYWSAKIGEISL